MSDVPLFASHLQTAFTTTRPDMLLWTWWDTESKAWFAVSIVAVVIVAFLRRALLGDMLAERAAANGWSGLVINGAIRDVDEIGATRLGVQALGTCPLKTAKLGMGQRDIGLKFGGALIEPGDYIYADNNGVIVSKRPLL